MSRSETHHRIDAGGRIYRLWYDKYTKNWILQHIDADGNQIGNAEFYYNLRAYKAANITHIPYVK